MVRFHQSPSTPHRVRALFTLSVGLFLSSNTFGGLQKTSFLDASDAPVPTTSAPREHPLLTPVLSRDNPATAGPATTPAVAPANTATSLPPGDEPAGSSTGLNFGMYDGQGLMAVANDPQPSTVADLNPAPRKSSGFDPLSPQGIAIGGGSLAVLAGVGWYLSRRRA